MWNGRDYGKEIIHKRFFKCLNKTSKTKLLSICLANYKFIFIFKL